MAAESKLDLRLPFLRERPCASWQLAPEQRRSSSHFPSACPAYCVASWLHELDTPDACDSGSAERLPGSGRATIGPGRAVCPGLWVCVVWARSGWSRSQLCLRPARKRQSYVIPHASREAGGRRGGLHLWRHTCRFSFSGKYSPLNDDTGLNR